MSAAKPTPRYVPRIPAANIQLVGTRSEAQVIPIRRVTPAYVPTIAAPSAPSRTPLRTKRAVPTAQRPWRVMLVPPTPDAPTRSFGVARWQAWVALALVTVSLLMAGGAVVALLGAAESPGLFGSGEVDQLRDRVEQLQDSLTLARADLATDDDAVGDSLFDALPGAAIPMPAGAVAEPDAKSTASRLTARKPALARTSRRGDEMPGLAPRSIEGLPVIGRLASGFSRSRRHPVLHIRRPHLGVDVAAPRGTHVNAPAAGTVAFVGRKFGFGLVVELRHSGSVVTRYAHLTETMVHVGDEVAKGSFIATVGSSGITTGPHLHYEVLVNGRQVDPLRYRLPAAPEGEGAVSRAPVVPDAASPLLPETSALPGPASGSHEVPAPAHAAPTPR